MQFIIIFVGLVSIGWLFMSETGLRIGLWMNGITGRHADDIVKHRRGRT